MRNGLGSMKKTTMKKSRDIEPGSGNVFADLGWPSGQVSVEQIVKRDPEVILLGDSRSPVQPQVGRLGLLVRLRGRRGRLYTGGKNAAGIGVALQAL